MLHQNMQLVDKLKEIYQGTLPQNGTTARVFALSNKNKRKGSLLSSYKKKEEE